MPNVWLIQNKAILNESLIQHSMLMVLCHYMIIRMSMNYLLINDHVLTFTARRIFLQHTLPVAISNPQWWRHQMKTFSALLAICTGNSPVTGEFPAQSPVTRCFDVFFDLSLNKRLSKQWWGWWFETPSRPLWRHCNANLAPPSNLLTVWNAGNDILVYLTFVPVYVGTLEIILRPYSCCFLGLLLLTWVDFYPSMDKLSHFQ